MTGDNTLYDTNTNEYIDKDFLLDDNKVLTKYLGNDLDVIVPKGITQIEKRPLQIVGIFFQ